MKAFQAIFPMDTRLEEQERETFWPIIHGLARHGIYAVDDDGQSVNHAVLSHVAPFRKVPGIHMYVFTGVISMYILQHDYPLVCSSCLVCVCVCACVRACMCNYYA